MKLTESEIAKFIEEEMKSDPALKNAIDKLSNKIDNLDVSIDYLASALTGEDVLDIGLSQKALNFIVDRDKILYGNINVFFKELIDFDANLLKIKKNDKYEEE